MTYTINVKFRLIFVAHDKNPENNGYWIELLGTGKLFNGVACKLVRHHDNNGVDSFVKAMRDEINWGWNTYHDDFVTKYKVNDRETEKIDEAWNMVCFSDVESFETLAEV